MWPWSHHVLLEEIKNTCNKIYDIPAGERILANVTYSGELCYLLRISALLERISKEEYPSDFFDKLDELKKIYSGDPSVAACINDLYQHIIGG